MVLEKSMSMTDDVTLFKQRYCRDCSHRCDQSTLKMTRCAIEKLTEAHKRTAVLTDEILVLKGNV